MNGRGTRIFRYLLAVAEVFAFLTFGTQALHATELSGSYEVVQKANIGARTRVRLRVHLTNREPRDLQIQRLTLFDGPRVDQSASQACSIALRSGTTADIEQEFNISHTEYELWRRGSRPRLVLELRTARGGKTTEVVRLDRIDGGKVN
jgi:hypothetical protein